MGFLFLSSGIAFSIGRMVCLSSDVVFHSMPRPCQPVAPREGIIKGMRQDTRTPVSKTLLQGTKFDLMHHQASKWSHRVSLSEQFPSTSGRFVFSTEKQ